MIKALIFDADGPLYQRGDNNKSQKIKLLSRYGFTSEYIAFDKAYNIEKFKAYVQTETEVTMFVNIFKTIGVVLDAQLSQKFTDEFNKIQSKVEPSPYARETLKWLHEYGYKISILTDSFFSASEKWPWFKRLGMDKYIDTIISSFDIKQLKDTQEAYGACLDKLDITASEALFVGHQQYEMDGAKKAGVTSICLKTISIPANSEGDFTIGSLAELKPALLSLSN